jgi:HSP20 family protein
LPVAWPRHAFDPNKDPKTNKERLNMLTRWNDFGVFPSLGFRDHPRLTRDLDRLFFAFDRPQTFAPRVTFEEREDAWVLRSELPGFSEKQIALTVTGTTVTLRVERAAEAKAEGDKAKAQPSALFERAFELPTKVDPEKVEAELKLGILTVTLPKASEAKPKQIAVKAA